MGTFVIKGRPTFLGKQNLGDFAHAIATDFGAEETDDTVLTDTTRSNTGGMFTFGFSMDCYYDAAVEELTIADVGNDVPLTFGSVDGTAQEIAYLINCKELTSSPFNASVGDMMALNVAGNAADRLVRGLLESNGTETSSGVSTGSQLGAVSATQKIYANLHCISASAGDTLDVISSQMIMGHLQVQQIELLSHRYLEVMLLVNIFLSLGLLLMITGELVLQ